MNEHDDVPPGEGQGAVWIEPPRRRRPQRRRTVYTRPFPVGRVILLLAVTASLAGVGLRLQYERGLHYAVALSGTPLVTLPTREAATEAILDLQRQYAPSAPESVTFREGQPEVIAIRQRAREADPAKAAKALDQKLTAVVQGFAILVGGKPLAMLGTMDQASEAVALMQQRGANGQDGIPTFEQRIRIMPRTQTEGDEHFLPVMSPQQVAEALVFPPRPRVHVVQKGDSFWSIGNQYGLTVQQLKEMNPGVDPGTLDLGDQVKVPDEHSPVNVIMRPQR